MTSKSELVELIRNTPCAPILNQGAFPSHGPDLALVFNPKMIQAERHIHELDIKLACNPRFNNDPSRKLAPSSKIADVLSAIHSADVSDVEFHHLCKLFAQDKSTESTIFWLATWALCKNKISTHVEQEILHFKNDDTVAQVAYALAYHIKWPHRWELFDAKIKHWRTNSRHAAHFVYVYEMMADPLNKGSESYESFMANNREGLFHATPYLGRTGRKNEAIERALYDLYQETGKKFILDYACELLKQGIDPVERFIQTVGNDAANVVSKKLSEENKKDRDEWFGVAAGKSGLAPSMKYHTPPSMPEQPRPTLGDLLRQMLDDRDDD